MQLKSKLIYAALAIAVFATLISSCETNQEQKIGIIVPLENKSLDEIVNGFTTTLRNNYPHINFKIANAQGDLNLQRAIIGQMQHGPYLMVVPIGTVATQMTAAAIADKSIVSLAANFSDQDRKKRASCNIAVVHDEVSPARIVDFIHAAQPQLTQLVLIHSASDKIYPDVQTAVAAGKTLGITVKPMMATTLNDLYSVAHAIPANTQGILILKDIMIASGIDTLKQVASARSIPLIAADEGSAEAGATFSLGVQERMIGEDGAALAHAILTGKKPCELPITEMTKLTVFINKETKMPEAIIAAAKKMHYAVEYVDRAGAITHD